MPNGDGRDVARVSGTWVADVAGSDNSSPEFSHEEIRLDVDGFAPQMAASGAVTAGLAVRVDWVAKLSLEGESSWRGDIFFKDGDVERFPYTQVEIRYVAPGDASVPPSVEPSLMVTYRMGAVVQRTSTYRLTSDYFRSLDLEIDTVTGATGVTSIDSHAHSNHPADIPRETLSIESIYGRAGIEVRRTGGSNVLPLTGAGENLTWDDAELHDAMQSHWSRYTEEPGWGMWLLFAERHDEGRELGGIMFDRTGQTQRQGAAVFTTSNIARPPGYDTEHAPWIARMTLFTVIHEMGHSLNLAHSWEKAGGTPWILQKNDPAALSFMNYPRQFPARERGFFAAFRYRFADPELLFMRHAPERFVRMGEAAWYDDHAFRQASEPDRPRFRLEVRTRPERGSFEFLEPVVLELKLTNTSGKEQSIPRDVLWGPDSLTVIVKRDRNPARRWAPYARYCVDSEHETLAADESRYGSVFVSAGLNGWDISEPGGYTIQIALHVSGEDVVSNRYRLVVEPPRERKEEVVAQDYFTDGVGRVLAMDGSRFLDRANRTLESLVERLHRSRAAIHARLALSYPLTRDFKCVEIDRSTGEKSFTVKRATGEEARSEMDGALLKRSAEAVKTLGNIDYCAYVRRFCTRLAELGDVSGAASRRRRFLSAISGVNSSVGAVLQSVMDAIAGGGAQAPDGRSVSTKRVDGSSAKAEPTKSRASPEKVTKEGSEKKKTRGGTSKKSSAAKVKPRSAKKAGKSGAAKVRSRSAKKAGKSGAAKVKSRSAKKAGKSGAAKRATGSRKKASKK